MAEPTWLAVWQRFPFPAVLRNFGIEPITAIAADTGRSRPSSPPCQSLSIPDVTAAQHDRAKLKDVTWEASRADEAGTPFHSGGGSRDESPSPIRLRPGFSHSRWRRER